MKRSDIHPMPQFFDRYINMVEDVDIFEAFEKYSPTLVYTDAERIGALGDQVYAPGKWTVRDILQHVIDNERIMSYRALRFSRNDDTLLPGYDEALLGAHTIANERSVQELLDEFSVVRAGSIALFRGMSGEMMQRSGVAFKSRISALALGFVIVGHPIHHMNIITERYFPLLQ